MFCYAVVFSMFYQQFNSIFIIICCIQARKALRALKGLVKIQALVRGYLVRKRAAATLHSMQALIRAQTAVRTQRARRSMSKENRFLPEVLARKSVVIKNWFSSPEGLPTSIIYLSINKQTMSYCLCCVIFVLLGTI